jgi:hypothetical protein
MKNLLLFLSIICYSLPSNAQIKFALQLGIGANGINKMKYVNPPAFLDSFTFNFKRGIAYNAGAVAIYDRKKYQVHFGLNAQQSTFSDIAIFSYYDAYVQVPLGPGFIKNVNQTYTSQRKSFALAIPISVHYKFKKFQVGAGLSGQYNSLPKYKTSYKLIRYKDDSIIIDSSYSGKMTSLKNLFNTSLQFYISKNIPLAKKYNLCLQLRTNTDLIGSYPFIDKNLGTPFFPANTTVNLKRANLYQNSLSLQVLFSRK